MDHAAVAVLEAEREYPLVEPEDGPDLELHHARVGGVIVEVGELGGAVEPLRTDNVVRNNGLAPDPASPFAFAASDLGPLTSGAHGNCCAGKVFGTSFSFIRAQPQVGFPAANLTTGFLTDDAVPGRPAT